MFTINRTRNVFKYLSLVSALIVSTTAYAMDDDFKEKNPITRKSPSKEKPAIECLASLEGNEIIGYIQKNLKDCHPRPYQEIEIIQAWTENGYNPKAFKKSLNRLVKSKEIRKRHAKWAKLAIKDYKSKQKKH